MGFSDFGVSLLRTLVVDVQGAIWRFFWFIVLVMPCVVPQTQYLLWVVPEHK